VEPGRRTDETRVGPPEYKASVGSNNATKLPFCAQVRNTAVAVDLGKLDSSAQCRSIRLFPTDLFTISIGSLTPMTDFTFNNGQFQEIAVPIRSSIDVIKPYDRKNPHG